jgi:hypothetical protein
MAESKYRTISINDSDYAEYDRIRNEISRDLGAKLSMAQIVKLAMTFYAQRRKGVSHDIQTQPTAKG